jgi:hypothetical protein
VINGETRYYKRGHTVGERSPWLKGLLKEDHPILKTIIGDGQSDYMNRADVREALHINPNVGTYEQCNNDMYITYMSYREGSVWIYPIL